jgi:hypothetical protein
MSESSDIKKGFRFLRHLFLCSAAFSAPILFSSCSATTFYGLIEQELSAHLLTDLSRIVTGFLGKIQFSLLRPFFCSLIFFPC